MYDDSSTHHAMGISVPPISCGSVCRFAAILAQNTRNRSGSVTARVLGCPVSTSRPMTAPTPAAWPLARSRNRRLHSRIAMPDRR